MPKVSVIMPAYNAEKYIGEAIDSILNQTFKDFEFIIIDDGSSDRTVDIIKGYDDTRIRFYQNEHNMGVAATLNRGLDMATGEYIARMDSDDISLPERFEKQVHYMDTHPEITVLATNVRNFGINFPAWPSSESNEALRVDLLFNSCICHPTVMMHGDIIYKNHIRYNEAFNRMEDYEMWERMIQEYEFCCLQEELYLYRMHPNQVTQTKDKSLFSQYVQLKDRTLKRLGLSVDRQEAVAFVKYCYGGFDLTQEEKADIRVFSMEIYLKNCEKKIYDDKLLKSSLLTVILQNCNTSREKRSFIREHFDWFGNTAFDKLRALKTYIQR